MATFQLFFQSREQVVVRRGQIRRIGWDQDTGSPGRPVSSGLQVPGKPGHCRARTRPPSWPSRDVFPSNVVPLHQQRWVILRVDSLSLWKIINEEDAVLIPKKSRREIFQRIFVLGIFWGGVSRYAATALIVALSPGHSDITRFRPWSPISKGNHLDRAEKIPNVAQTTGTFDVFDPSSGISEPHEYGPNPLTWDAQLLSYSFSRNPRLAREFG